MSLMDILIQIQNNPFKSNDWYSPTMKNILQYLFKRQAFKKRMNLSESLILKEKWNVERQIERLKKRREERVKSARLAEKYIQLLKPLMSEWGFEYRQEMRSLY